MRSLLYRIQSNDLLCKSIDWFLYDRDLRHERVKFSSSKPYTLYLDQQLNSPTQKNHFDHVTRKWTMQNRIRY